MAKGPGRKKTLKAPTTRGSLHAPLEMKSRTHDDYASESSDGAASARAAHKRRARQSMIARLISVSLLPALMLIVVGAYVYLWFSGASSLKAMIADTEADHGPNSWTVRSDEPDVGGFPFRVQAKIPNMEIVAPDRWGDWIWKAEMVVLEVDPWNLRKPRIKMIGHSQLKTASGAVYDISSQDSLATLSLAADQTLKGLDITLGGLAAQPSGGAPPLQVGSLQISGHAMPLPLNQPVDSHTVTYEGSLTVSDAVLPEEMAPQIGPSLNRLEVNGRLLGKLGEGSLRERLTKWRDDGGVAELDHLFLDWSPLKMAATGTIALDDRMQPVGALSTQIQGFFEAVDTLYGAHIMRARDATLARVVLGTMAENKAGIPTLTTPMSLQSGSIILGPVTVMELPPIEWPGPAVARQLPSMRPAYQVDRWGNIVRQK